MIVAVIRNPTYPEIILDQNHRTATSSALWQRYSLLLSLRLVASSISLAFCILSFACYPISRSTSI